jgi:hypothetical protein
LDWLAWAWIVMDCIGLWAGLDWLGLARTLQSAMSVHQVKRKGKSLTILDVPAANNIK